MDPWSSCSCHRNTEPEREPAKMTEFGPKPRHKIVWGSMELPKSAIVGVRTFPQRFQKHKCFKPQVTMEFVDEGWN